MNHRRGGQSGSMGICAVAISLALVLLMDSGVPAQSVSTKVIYTESGGNLTVGQYHSRPLYTHPCSNSSWSITFFANASGGTAPYSFVWTFGDGSADSTDRNVTHVFPSWGIFNVSIAVKDVLRDTATSTIVVESTPPPCAPLPIIDSANELLLPGIGVGAIVAAVGVVLAFRHRNPGMPPRR